MHPLEEITRRIERLLTRQDSVLVAIDGSCTAGKTTLADQLCRKLDCNVIHMDDYFLRPEQRTPERFAQAGGNVDYERFFEEVLLPLKAGMPFSYCPFDCSTLELAEPVAVTPKRVTIIEGTYSLHPHFGDVYDLKVLLTITPELQRERVLGRPAFLHRRFFGEWIPMENQYFAQLQIREKSDLIF